MTEPVGAVTELCDNPLWVTFSTLPDKYSTFT
jgi:hypothetical protein